MNEEIEKMSQYYITLKYPQAPYVGYQDPKKAAIMEAHQENLRKVFFKVVNAVVDLGGVICMDKHQLDNDYRLFSNGFSIQIAPSLINTISKMPEVSNWKLESNLQ